MYVNITRKEDLDYLLEVLEEKGYQWLLNRLPPTSRRVMTSELLNEGVTLGISKIRHTICGSYFDADTGFNEIFDLI